MWYASLVTKPSTAQVVDDAKTAVSYAASVRKYHAKRTERDSQQRVDDISMALKRLKEAMKPLRSAIGRFPYGPQTEAVEKEQDKVRAASLAIQRERRKLWKMRPKPRNPIQEV